MPRNNSIAIIFLLAVLLLIPCCTRTGIENIPVPPTNTPTPNPTPEPTPNPTPEPTPNPTPEPTPNPTPEPTPNPTPEPTPMCGTYFAPFVTKKSGWYDVNKKKDGRGKDGLFCWAAATSNILQWWQDIYLKAGNNLPFGTPNGKGKEYELAIFENFLANWTNAGCWSIYGFNWYFTGISGNEGAQGDEAQPKKNTGGYYKSQFEQIKSKWPSPYLERYSTYSLWGSSTTGSSTPRQIFTNILFNELRHGVLTMTINVGFSSLHEVTVWGCIIDSSNMVSHLYITDSDDLIYTPKAERTPLLQCLELKEDITKRELGLKTSYKPFTELRSFTVFRIIK